MPRRKRHIISGREGERVDCVSFYRDRLGKPACHALNDVYCLKEEKPCSFKVKEKQKNPADKNIR